MKTIKYSILMMLGVFLLASCEQDNEFVNDVQGGEKPNLVLFNSQVTDISNVANDNEYDVGLTMKVRGPRMKDVSGDITVTLQPTFKGIKDSVVSGSAGSTNQRAEEGTNFKIPKNKLTLKESENYIGKFHLKMLTDGITAPLSTSKKLKLKVTDVSGNKTVKAAKAAQVNLTYACPSNIQGTYNIEAKREDGKVFTNNGVEVKERKGVGKYDSGSIAGFWTTPGSPYRPGNVAEHGVLFNDVCGDLTVEDQDLGGIAGNEVGGVEMTEVNGNSQTGNITSFELKYYVTFSDTKFEHTATYTKQ